ncbi:hypothetical protein JCM9279_001597 [Rhodotorula babjevae]
MHLSAALVAGAALSALSTNALPLDAPFGAQAQLAFAAPSPAATAPSRLTPASLPTDALVQALRQVPSEYVGQLEAHIASLPERRKVRLADGAEALDVSEGEKALLFLAGQRFIDVTDEHLATSSASVADKGAAPFPKSLSHSAKALSHVFAKLDTKRMHKFLESFTGFRTRYYRSDTGKQSQQFLLGQVRQVAASDKSLGITVREFKHSWGQNSIIARIEPEHGAKNQSEAVVILGAHQDSTNLLPFLSAPGADDDASGTTSSLSAFTALVESGFRPSHAPVEFHWYSAEEGGLLGSQAVAQDYAARGVKVRSMLQMDMSASGSLSRYVKPGTNPTIGIIQDFVDPAFTEYLTRVVDEYAEIPAVKTQCGYACSDHASWSKVGAPSAFTIESTFELSDKNIHSSRDTIDQEGYSLDHVKQFARVAIALAVELGGGASVVA